MLLIGNTDDCEVSDASSITFVNIDLLGPTLRGLIRHGGTHLFDRVAKAPREQQKAAPLPKVKHEWTPIMVSARNHGRPRRRQKKDAMPVRHGVWNL